MDNFDKNKSELKDKTRDFYETAKEQISEAYYETKPKAEALSYQVKNTVSDLYEDNKKKINSLEECIVCFRWV